MPIELTLKNYLWVQAILFLAGLAFLLWKPKRRQGLRLKFGKATGSAQNSQKPGNLVEFNGSERSLQIYFNYNGETFEVYEVFGVPAGSSLTKVEQAMRDHGNLQGPESRAFVEAAFQALKSSHKSAKN